MKTCSECKEVKALTEFGKHKQKKDGLRTQCKGCIREYNKRYRTENHEAISEWHKRNYLENKEAASEYQRRYYAENKEVVAERRKRYRTENNEAIGEYNRRYYAENHEAERERNKRYAKENPDVIRRGKAKRRALEAEAYVEGAYIPTYEELVTFYGKPCLYPGCENTDTTYDHIVAYANGGKNVLANLQPLCKSHNSGKRDYNSTDYRTGAVWAERINGEDVIFRRSGRVNPHEEAH